MDKLNSVIGNIFSDEKLIKIIFSNKRLKSLSYNKVQIKPLKLQSLVKYQVEYTFDKKVTHRNISLEEAMELSVELLAQDFKQANAFTLCEDIQILAAKPHAPRVTTSPPTKGMPSLEHNKKKNYIIEENSPCDFLIRLGVMDSSGKVVQKHYSKFRQINRYLEIVEDVFPSLPGEKTLKIIDFGCGKAYLTFALYYYLKVLKKRNVEIIGLDLKKDVILFCQKIADDLNYNGLHFIMGDIADYTNDSADMVVTLHACDTATDYALINAVAWNTKVILSVPCCQHELFNQISNDTHNPILKYGILKDRLTEYLTDGLRGLKLESKGYQVSMIEFVSLEHTAKNIMIRAVKTGTDSSKKSLKALSQYEALRDFYNVNPTIEQL